MGFSAPSLKGRALRWLAQREHSRAELERKLRPHETEPGEVERALDELQAKGFLSEQRALDSVLHRRAGQFGAARLQQDLRARGIDEALIRPALQALRDTELERATEVWRKKFGQAPLDAKERARQARFMAARGFGGDTLSRLWRAVGDAQASD